MLLLVLLAFACLVQGDDESLNRKAVKRRALARPDNYFEDPVTVQEKDTGLRWPDDHPQVLKLTPIQKDILDEQQAKIPEVKGIIRNIPVSGHAPDGTLPHDSEYLHVFTTMCEDSRFIAFGKAMVRSLVSKSVRKPIHFHILHDDSPNILRGLIHPLVEMDALGMLGSSPGRFRFSHSATTVPERLKNEFKRCACSRLMLPQEFPELGLVAYVDADTVINADMADLFDLADRWTEHQWIAMAEAGIPAPTNTKRKFFGRTGVNTGVLLVDLNKWRKTGFTDYFMNFDGLMRIGDQDIMNAYFVEHPDEIDILPCEWNYRLVAECPVLVHEVKIFHGNAEYFNLMVRKPSGMDVLKIWDLTVWFESIGRHGNPLNEA